MATKFSDLATITTINQTDTVPILNGALNKAVTWSTIRGGVFDVVDYGALADGATDDATAIQAAIDAAEAAGGGVVRVRGICGVGTAGWTGLHIDSDNVWLVGADADSGLKVLATPSQQMTGTNPCTLVITADHVRVQNLDINGNAIEAIAIGMEGCSNCEISGNYIHDTGTTTGAACTSLGGFHNRYLYNRVHNCREGIVHGSTAATDSDLYESFALIHGNRITACSNGSGLGGVLVDSTLSDNVSTANSNSGCIINGSAYMHSDRVTLTNNVLTYNGFSGFQMDVSGSGYVTNVTIHGGLYAYNDSDGLNLSNCEHVVVHGAIAKDNNADGSGNGYGFNIGTHAVDVVLDGCLGYCTEGTPLQTDGVHVVGASTDVTDISIVGGSYHDNATYGVFINAPAGATIERLTVSGVKCCDNARGLFVMQESTGVISDVICTGNTAVGNSVYDLRFTGAADFKFSSNRYDSIYAGTIADAVAHDYGGAAADWSLTAIEAAGTEFSISNASGAVNMIFPAAQAGRLPFAVVNGSGYVLTVKVTGQSGITIANGKTALCRFSSSDVVEIYEQP